MKRRMRLFAVITVSAVVAALGTPASAAPTTISGTIGSAPSATALAAEGAAAVVAGRPAYLHASAGDQFIQRPVVSQKNTQYVPYERTYQGLPVIGGDFVLVTNSSGGVV